MQRNRRWQAKRQSETYSENLQTLGMFWGKAIFKLKTTIGTENLILLEKRSVLKKGKRGHGRLVLLSKIHRHIDSYKHIQLKQYIHCGK